MAHAESSGLSTMNGTSGTGGDTPDPHIEAVLGKISEAPVEQQEFLARDAFLEGGYRRLASNMISLAIRDLLREPKVQPAGKNKAMRDAQDAREWINGAGSDLSFTDCLAALGMDEWREGLRQFILENPESASELFRAYERSYYEHLDPAMSSGLPESTEEDMAGDEPADGFQREPLGTGLYPLRWAMPGDTGVAGEHSGPNLGRNLRLPTLEELGMAALVGAKDAQRLSATADEGWTTEPMRPH